MRAASEPARRPSRRHAETRVYGYNACLALFAHRPHDLRKVYLTEARIADFQAVLAWCVEHRLGYRVVTAEDLERLTQSRHHEGVCFDVRARPLGGLSSLMRRLPPGPALLAWLDGVANPHNVGAILRSAAHFGAAGVLLSPLPVSDLPGATYRVAEGGAEALSLARVLAGENAPKVLRESGFVIAATVPRAGESIYAARLPSRLVLLLGAESEGLSSSLRAIADLHLTIPGTGRVESLNVAVSAAVLFGEYYRQHRAPLRARR
jgi:TrmH RNA methyltransferase